MTQLFARLTTWVLIAYVACGLPAHAAPTIEQAAARLEQAIAPLVRKGMVPGAVITVVSDKQVWVRGYGQMADGPNARAIDLNTLFRIGSVSKTMTAVAAWQLVGEGRLDLDADVRRYVPDIIPANGPTIKVRDLFTHQAGFDGDVSFADIRGKATGTTSPKMLPRQFVRTYAPRTVTAYDNAAFGLLGLIVARIEKQPLANVLRNRVFAPIGMKTAVLGLPVAREREAAQCHQLVLATGPAPCQHQRLSDFMQGAGDVSATGSDMAAYAQALLKQARSGSPLTMTASSFAQMTNTKAQQLRSGIAGIGYGVYEIGASGAGGFGHSGSIRGFNTMLVILPKENLAAFVAVNVSEAAPDMAISSVIQFTQTQLYDGEFSPGELLSLQLPNSFARWAQNAPVDAQPAGAVSADHAIKVEGRYFGTRSGGFQSLLPRLLLPMLSPPFAVEALPDGQLRIAGEGPYREISPYVYERSGDYGIDKKRFAFRFLANGGVEAGPHTILTSVRVPWWFDANLTVLPFLISFVVLLVGGCAFVFRKQYRRPSVVLLLGLAGIAATLWFELDLATWTERVSGQDGIRMAWRIGYFVSLLATGFGIWSLLRAMQASGMAQRKRLFIVTPLGCAGLVMVTLSVFWVWV